MEQSWVSFLQVFLFALLSSCEDMYKTQAKYEGEVVYPARFDIIIGHIGYERIELDLMKAGRIRSSQIKMGKAKKTIIEYDGKVETIDSLVSWVNIPSLTSAKLYRFKVYTIDEFGNKSVPQGIALIPFIRKAGDISSGNMQALKDLLENGILTKVYYRPNSMGLDAPARVGLENVYKTVLKGTSASFVFVLPKGYQFNIKEYRYLKMKVYAPAKTSFSGEYSPYQRIWTRFMNNLWSFAENSNFGQEYWEYSRDQFWINDADLQTWKDITIDMSNALNRHNRVIVLNIGGEPSPTWPPPVDIVKFCL